MRINSVNTINLQRSFQVTDDFTLVHEAAGVQTTKLPDVQGNFDLEEAYDSGATFKLVVQQASSSRIVELTSTPIRKVFDSTPWTLSLEESNTERRPLLATLLITKTTLLGNGRPDMATSEVVYMQIHAEEKATVEYICAAVRELYHHNELYAPVA